MKKLLFTICLLLSTVYAQKDSADIILGGVYGTLGTACTRDSDIDTGGANRIGPLSANRRYLVYCHDGAGAGVACKFLQGTSSVDASSGNSVILYAGEKIIVKVTTGKTYISATPFVDNQQLDACPLD